MASSALLALPREVRDMIYVPYFTIDGGYVFNQASGKLKAATPRAHALALRRTCRRVAEETRGLALACNAVSFSTVDNMRDAAFMFDFLASLLVRYEEDKLKNNSASITEAVRDHVRCRYPEFLPALDQIRADSDRAQVLINSTGVAPSLHREYVRCALEAFPAGVHPDMLNLARDLKLWLIPSPEELDYLTAIIRPNIYRLEFLQKMHGVPMKQFDGVPPDSDDEYVFSAAAVAIRFLHSIPTMRLHIRRIILHEDREAVATPATHGKGLVPFCDENPRLRIERRVNLWTNAFRNPYHSVKTLLRFPIPYPSSYDVADWMLEAQELPSSISLVLDGSPQPEECSEKFRQMVVRNAMWQAALEESFKRQNLPFPGHWEWTVDSGAAWVCKDFYRLIRDLSTGSSRTRCDFPLAEFGDNDVEKIVCERHDWSLQDWDSKWWAEVP